MAKIPAFLHGPINSAYPQHVCQLGSIMADGYPQIGLRGSIQVYDDEHISFWDRGKGTTKNVLKDGEKLAVFFRNPELREKMPGGAARFYGTAVVHKSGPVYEEVWKRLIENEKKGDPDKKGFAVLIKIERAEKLNGQPLTD